MVMVCEVNIQIEDREIYASHCECGFYISLGETCKSVYAFAVGLKVGHIYLLSCNLYEPMLRVLCLIMLRR